MNVSVVICAYTLDRWDDLCSAVESCADQTLRPHEILVVIDHNDELHDQAQRAFKDVVVLANQSTKGLSGARNTGVASSSGDVVAFLDDDAFADVQWLEHLTQPFDDAGVAGVAGWIVPAWPGGAPQWFPRTFYWVLGCSYSGLPPDGASIRNPIGANMAIRRRVFERVGGFSSGIGRVGRNPLGCEETELCIRYASQFADERFVLRRSAIVHHRVPPSRLTWQYFWRRCWAEGVSKATVSSLVGSKRGLAAERRHALHSLPREIVQSLRDFPRTPRSASVRMALILTGTVCAALGLLGGTVALRRSPVKLDSGELDALARHLRGDEGRWPPTERSAD